MTVQLVASCTERKRAVVPPELQLRDINGCDDHASAWLNRLAEHPVAAKRACELYGGEHWQLVLSLESTLSERGVELSVASAGYGLVSAKALLKPYSATFALRQPDSVPAEASAWWNALCDGHSQANRLQTLAAKADTLVVIASAPYLQAMLPDLHLARKALSDPQQLIVFSGSQLAGFESSVVQVDDRVQKALQGPTSAKLAGTRPAMAARTALHLLTATETWPPTAEAMQTAYARLVSGQDRPEPIDRERHGDDDVRAFILKGLDENPRVGWTKLLRSWRDSGRACEQKRFRGLYLEVQAERK